MTYDEAYAKYRNLIGWTLYNKFHVVSDDQEYDDLYQEACVALMNAVDSYDESKGEFSTYLVTSIIHCLNKYKSKFGNFGGMGVYNSFLREHYKSVRAYMNGEISFDELQEIIGVDSYTLIAALNCASGCVSLNTPIGESNGDEGEGTLEYFIEDKSIMPHDTNVIYDDAIEWVKTKYSSLHSQAKGCKKAVKIISGNAGLGQN